MAPPDRGDPDHDVGGYEGSGRSSDRESIGVRDIAEPAPGAFSESDRIADLIAEREQERTGRFGVFSDSVTRDKTTDIYDRVFSALRKLSNFVPGIGQMANFGLSLIDIGSMKARGYSDDQINDRVGRSFIDMATGGMFSRAEALGKGLQSAARGVGMTGGPQQSFGEQAPGPGLGVPRDETAVPEQFDRESLARAREAMARGRQRASTERYIMTGSW